MKTMDPNDNRAVGAPVSIVVCVRNGAALLEGSLKAVKKEVPEAELIVVDGNSTDGSAEIARRYADIVVSDEGKGLAYARQLGINNSNREFVSFVGPDNLITKNLISAMRAALESDKKTVAVAPQTEVIDAGSYWEQTTKYILKIMINRPGLAETIGTPCMYKRDVVMAIQYDTQIKNAGDDADLSLRLRNAGYRLAIVDAYTQEKNSLDHTGFVNRWRWYGKGDAEFYRKHYDSWTWKRRLMSLTHPLRKYGIYAPVLFLLHGVPQYIPGLYVAMWSRYSGWWQRARELRHG